MVNIIVEIFFEHLAIVWECLLKAGFFLIFALTIESTILYGIILKFRSYVRTYLYTLYLEKLELIKNNSTKKEIFFLFFIDEIMLVLEILENLDYHDLNFIIKAIKDYISDRTIISISRLFSFKNRVFDKISNYFTIDRHNALITMIIIFLHFVNILRCIICFVWNVVEYLVKKATFNALKFCKRLLTFFRSF
jgi:hypothetical protein